MGEIIHFSTLSEKSRRCLGNSFYFKIFKNKSDIWNLNIRVKQRKIMGLIREPLNIDLVINSNANAQELEKIDLMIHQIKMRNKPLAHRIKAKKVLA